MITGYEGKREMERYGKEERERQVEQDQEFLLLLNISNYVSM